jgi:ABC-type multidrug transport system fused ATPase/permease subunit
MKVFEIYRDINGVIPDNNKKKLTHFFLLSILFSMLDLLSIGYLIPAVLFLLDKNKLVVYFSEHDIPINILNSSNLIIGVVLLVAIFVLKNLLQVHYNIKLYNFLYSMSHQLSMSILERYLNNDYLAFQKQNKGNLMQNISRVTNDFCATMLSAFILLISESFTFLIIAIFLLYFYFTLSIIAIIAICIFGLIIYKIKKEEVLLINETYKKSYANANSELLNILDGYIEIKTSGNKQQFLNQYKIHNQLLNRVTSMLTSSSGNYSKYLELFLVVAIASLIFVNYIFFKGTESITLIAILGALSIKIVPSLSKILNAITMVNSHYYSIGILKEIKQTQNEGTTYTSFNDCIETRQVYFKYDNEILILENINFKIKRGDIIAIKGFTGSGKSTFLHVLSGILQPSTGEVLIDNQIINPNCFFEFISYVPQHPFLFNGTLLENITMRQQSEYIDRAYIDFLMEKLELKAMIDNLTDGLNTLITHNTSKLSGGQKQRITLMRALYKKPQLLILDEATNQQNDEMEIKIFNLIKQIVVANQMAVLVVSHQPNIYQFCDAIYNLDQNNLVELVQKPAP